MLEYNYFEALSLEDLNNLSSEGWQVQDVLTTTSPTTFNALMFKGFQDKTLVENSETGARFWLSENVSYGEAFIIFVVIAFAIAIISRSIYRFIFQQL